MSIKYASYTVNVSGLDTTIDFARFFGGYLKEMVKAHLGGVLKKQSQFRDEYESDIDVELEETAGEDPTYIAPVCKNCQFWIKMIDSERGNCTSPKFRYGYGSVEKIRPVEPDEIQVENDEGWGTQCGPEFGCIHYDERVHVCV